MQLAQIRLQNFALFDQADASFESGLNVISGESGAGKTVLLRAIEIGLGAKPEPSLVGPACDQATIELVFSGVVPEALSEFVSAGTDDEDFVLTRIIRRNGRSATRVNGQTVSSAALRDLDQPLIEIVGQHSARNLVRSSYQRELIDSQLEHNLLDRVVSGAAERSRLLVERDDAEKEWLETGRIADLISEDLRLFEKVNPQPGEIDAIEIELARLGSAEQLEEDLSRLITLIDGESGILVQLNAGQTGRLAELSPKIDSKIGETIDLVNQLRSLGEDHLSKLDLDRAEELNRRRDQLRKIERRFREADPEKLAERFQRDRQLLERWTDRVAIAKRTEEQLKENAAELSGAAAELAAARKKAAKKFAQGVQKQLRRLGLGEAELLIDWQTIKLGKHGSEQAQIKLRANKKLNPVQLGEGASGGELSRIMLAILLERQQRSGASCYLFDEVDSGIGGETAHSVASALADLGGGDVQLIVITHLAQIAERAAGKHLGISKSASGARLLDLDEKERDRELARLMGVSGADLAAADAAVDALREAGQ